MHDTLAGAVDSFFVASSHDPLDATPEKINKSDDAGGAQEKIDGGGQQLGRAEIVEGVIGGGGIGEAALGFLHHFFVTTGGDVIITAAKEHVKEVNTGDAKSDVDKVLKKHLQGGGGILDVDIADFGIKGGVG